MATKTAPSSIIAGAPARLSAEKTAAIFSRKGFLMCFLSGLMCFLVPCFSTHATNIVTYSVSDTAKPASDKLELEWENINNADNRVRVSFVLKSAGVPFTIYSARWLNCDSIREPLEPFSLIAQPDEVAEKITEWHISLDFPFSGKFEETDALVLNTDKGTVRCPTSSEGKLIETINLLHKDYENQLEVSKKSSQTAWTVLSISLIFIFIGGAVTFIALRRRLIRKRKEIEELSMLISERTDRNIELQSKVDALYGSRLDTLNMLCNEYFEKSDSEKLRLTLYNEVEKHILALRDSKSIAELESIVNRFLDNILVRIKEQLPELGKKNLVFLTYLYAGFSPRAVCIFTDIKIKNFYNRRSRLRDSILASDAPDKEFFVSKM